MKSNNLTLQQERMASLIEREIRIIIYRITRDNNLGFLPISHCECDRKFQDLKVYVSDEDSDENKKLIEKFSKDYTSLIKSKLAFSKKFRKIPKITLLLCSDFGGNKKK